MIPVRVTLRIHSFGNQVGSQFSHVPVVKRNDLVTGVKDRVSICNTGGVTINIPFPSSHASPGEGALPWEEEFSSNVVITVLGRNFNVALIGVKVKDVRVKRIMLRSQVFRRKVLGCGRWALGVVYTPVECSAHLNVSLALEFFVSQVPQG